MAETQEDVRKAIIRCEALKLAVQVAIPGAHHSQILQSAAAFEEYIYGTGLSQHLDNKVGDSEP